MSGLSAESVTVIQSKYRLTSIDALLHHVR